MSLSRARIWLSLPNLLSLSRLPLGGLFWPALGPTASRSPWAFVVMALAAVTDVLDGRLARRDLARAHAARASAGTEAVIGDGGTGAWLDPICDKVFVASVLGAILVRRHPPPWLVALIVSRELIQLPLSLVYRFFPVLRLWLRYDFRASALGKAATVVQFLAIAALIVDARHPASVVFATLAFLLGVAALIDYVLRAIAIGRARLERPPPPGHSGIRARRE